VALGDGRGQRDGRGREDLVAMQYPFIHVQAPPSPSSGSFCSSSPSASRLLPLDPRGRDRGEGSLPVSPKPSLPLARDWFVSRSKAAPPCLRDRWNLGPELVYRRKGEFSCFLVWSLVFQSNASGVRRFLAIPAPFDCAVDDRCWSQCSRLLVSITDFAGRSERGDYWECSINQLEELS
jgi:hypothetical protein